MTSEALNRAITSLAVLDVYLGETSAKLASGFDPKRDAAEYSVQARHRAEEAVDVVPPDDGAEQRIVVFRISTGVRLVARDAGETELNPGQESRKPRILAELTAVFVAEYRVTSPELPDEKALKAFASQNALFHVWPYWREYVQSMCARLRLPQIMLPMFRLPDARSSRGVKSSNI